VGKLSTLVAADEKSFATLGGSSPSLEDGSIRIARRDSNTRPPTSETASGLAEELEFEMSRIKYRMISRLSRVQ
jgi:hypothetical protein